MHKFVLVSIEEDTPRTPSAAPEVLPPGLPPAHPPPSREHTDRGHVIVVGVGGGEGWGSGSYTYIHTSKVQHSYRPPTMEAMYIHS